MGHSASVSRKRIERADRRIEEAELAKKQLQELQENAEKIKGSFRRCIYNGGEGSSSTSALDSHVAEYRRYLISILTTTVCLRPLNDYVIWNG